MRARSLDLMKLLFAAILLWGAEAQAAMTDKEAKMAEVIEVLSTLGSIPEESIPPVLLRNAKGIAIIPGVIKLGLVIGGRYGKGFVVLKSPEGDWGEPVFLSITGGSIDWQLGAQSTDVVLVFKSRKSVEGMVKGKFTLGVDAAVAAGPLGRQASAATDTQLQAEIYSYSRSRGLFAGISLDGAALSIQHKDNARYYNRPGILPKQIFNGEVAVPPASALKLQELLSNQAKN